MQIFLKEVVCEAGLKEWAMIELQGDLESKEQESLGGQLVGDLYYNNEGTPILIIGHHILYGKVQSLVKPMGVLEKSVKLGVTEYVIKAIIKRKIFFRERPKPIVATAKTARHSE